MLLLLLAVLSFHCRHMAHSHRACAKMRLLLLLAVLSFHCRHSHSSDTAETAAGDGVAVLLLRPVFSGRSV